MKLHKLMRGLHISLGGAESRQSNKISINYIASVLFMLVKHIALPDNTTGINFLVLRTYLTHC